MILLDENIPEDQCKLLRKWRIRFRQIGQDVGRKGMKDEQHIIPLLHKLDDVTFLTRDFGFFDGRWCHDNYALIYFAVSQSEVAHYIKRFLRHPSFNTKAKRMGAVVRVSPVDLRTWRPHAEEEEAMTWDD